MQFTLEVGVFATASLLAGKLGATPLAAHQIVLQVASVTFMVPLGISAAAAVRVAQHLGMEQPHRARITGSLSIGCSALMMASVGVLLYLLASPLLQAFTPDTEVVAVGTMLIFAAAFFQLFDAVQVVSTGVLRGVGNTKISMFANLIGHWFVGLPAGYFLAFSLVWGVLGIWMGLSLGLITVASSLVLAWRRIAPNASVY
jgi:MATE family multidrug resistance protein